jgi:hypothetical protein
MWWRLPRSEFEQNQGESNVPKGGRLALVSSFIGMPSAFARAGFVECARPWESKLIMQCYLE